MKRVVKAAICWLFVLILVCSSAACQGGEVKTDILPEDYTPRVGGISFDDGTLPNITGLYTVDTDRDILWGFNNMYHPTIVKVNDKKYPYRMYFFGWAFSETNVGWPGCDAIFLARGKNLDHWEVYSRSKETRENYWDVPDEENKYTTKEWMPIVTASDNWYDNWHNGDPSVIYKDGKYYMAYSAYGLDKDGYLSNTNGDTDGDISCIMGAVSTDGINFEKTSYPIAIWEDEIGKKEPVTSDGSGFTSTPFYGLYHRPSILYDETAKCWKMWFDYINEDLMAMGYAENHGDFMNPDDWEVIRAGDNPCLPHMCNPDVKYINGKYFCYGDPDATYYGASNDRLNIDGWTKRQLVEAQSDDGINWTVTGYILPDEDTFADHVPCIYYEQGVLFLFYATQIGYGDVNETEGVYDYKYDRLRYMIRSIDYQYENDKNFAGPYQKPEGMDE